jgi:lipoprotein-anchoring transpeptidase ErfK/SrfK
VLGSGEVDVFKEYTVTEKDAAGPFVKVPADPMERAKLPHLGYEDLTEALAEKFHMSPALLKELNRGKAIEAGATLKAPDVQSTKPTKAASLRIFKKERVLVALDAKGLPVALFPISLGSVRDELPVGTLKIANVATDPSFDYTRSSSTTRIRTTPRCRSRPGRTTRWAWRGWDSARSTTGSTARPTPRRSAIARPTAACTSPTGTR